ncbi:12-oxophytodienoate reductase [Opitutaceae bacterium TAV5]|nr:12-oxophytodienoate reductase [Opitutaceae bacterium TAV5]
MNVQPLFQPFRTKSLRLRNRIVMAPMTRSFAPGGVLSPEVAGYYTRRAAADVGLILSEGTVVNRTAASLSDNVPHFHGEKALAAWKTVIDSVHAAGGTMAPQLWHMGAVRAPEPGGKTLPPQESPSGLVPPDHRAGAIMSEADIADTVAAFAQAAADAKRLGFQAIEIHGAHGYLIDQFFWSVTNRRTDRYGGATLRERSRFATEIVRAIRAAVGPDFAIILRLSQWKQQDYSAKLAATPQEMETWLTPLVAAGVDILHCSQRRFHEPEFPDSGSDLNFAGWAKKLTGAPTITVGSVGLSGEFIASLRQGEGASANPGSLGELLRRFERGDFDLVAVGRPLLADPEWVRKIHQGRTAELRAFSKDDLLTLS